MKKLSVLCDTIAVAIKALEGALVRGRSAEDIGEESEWIRDAVLAEMSALRAVCDEAETMTAEKYWPFPTYGDLLFGVR